MTFLNNMDRDQAPGNVGLNLRYIMSDTQYHLLLKTICFAWNELNSEDIEICQFYKLSKNFLRALYISQQQYLNSSPNVLTVYRRVYLDIL